MPKAVTILARDPIQPAICVQRVHYRGDPHLPKLEIEIIRSVQRAA